MSEAKTINRIYLIYNIYILSQIIGSINMNKETQDFENSTLNFFIESFLSKQNFSDEK